MGKVKDFFGGFFDQILDSGKEIPKIVLNTSQSEAYATALQLVFGGKPEYRKMEDGKMHFFWTGVELVKAQNTVKAMAKGNPNSKTSVDLIPVITPVVMGKLVPVVGVGVLLKMLSAK